MALIVAPAAGFDSYISKTDADAYFLALGVSDWAPLIDATKEAALRRGSQYIGARRLIDIAVSPTVHPNVRAATCEAAYRWFKGLLYKDVPAQLVKQKTIGPLTTIYTDPVQQGQTKFPIIEDLLYGLTMTGYGSGTVYFERA